MDFRMSIAEDIVSALQQVYGETGLSAGDVASAIEIPPDTAMGDYAFPCFRLAKTLRKAPPMIAESLKEAVSAPFLAKVEAVKGYLNFYIDRAVYALWRR